MEKAAIALVPVLPLLAWLAYHYHTTGRFFGNADFYQYNGWTLHFFNTPRAGLRDQWLTLRYALGNFTLYAESHRFGSDFGGIGLGRENDAGITYAAMENLLVRLQHARYDPGTGTPDPSIRKTWLTLTFTY